MKKKKPEIESRVQEELDVDKDIKRLKIVDELVMAIGSNKLVFKKPGQKHHVTVKITPDNILDIHKTYEGKRKRHKSLANIDLNQIEIKAVEELETILNLAKEAEVDFKDPTFQNYWIMLEPKEDKIFEKAGIRKGRDLIIDEGKLNNEELKKKFKTVPFIEAPKHEFKSARVFTKENRFIGNLSKIKGRYYFLTIEFAKELMRVLGIKS